MASTNLDSANLKAVDFGGFVREDVMQALVEIQKIDLPFTNLISSDSVKNSYSEWPKFTYSPPDLDNAVIDGADAGTDDSTTGARVGNHAQISRKHAFVSSRARSSDTIGSSDEYTTQVMRALEHCRRDVEAISMSNQASVADDGSATAGRSGGLNAWLTTNTDRGATGADGGFANGTVSAATLGTIRPLTETAIRDVAQSIYEQGFNATVLMCRPAVKRIISEYMFTDTARIGKQQTETGKGGGSAAVGYVTIFFTDFADLQLTDNRLQPYMDAGAGDSNDSVFLLTPEYLSHGFLRPWRTEELAKIGLSDRAQISADWMLKVRAEEAQGVIADVDATQAMTL